ncbi:hypothetical protein M9Y10_031601 [Tritrichomonas musculus]|uniref:HTH psq-type domain-containing protein n=1 Tax=Tritrichomonas musculus TaxID=1915356 RepID=A0ABR2H124_9EUKA
MKANGCSLERIANKHDITKQAMFSSICATLKGSKWDPHSEKGGTDSYLGDADVNKFKAAKTSAPRFYFFNYKNTFLRD